MIARLKRRFIRIVMEVFSLVLILILLAVNLGNRQSVYTDIDRRLVYISESAMGPPFGMVASTPAEVRNWVELNSAGIMNETSYFIFSGYMTGPILQHELDMLSVVLAEDGAAAVSRILAGSANFGNVRNYRYYVADRDTPYKLILINCEQEFSAMRSLFRTSILVGAASFLLVLLFTALLSDKAIQPFARNIENQNRFIANASHELKTPLGVIMSDLDLQIMESGETEWLQNAQLQADHMAILIKQLTAFSLLDEHSRRGAKETVDLSAMGMGIAADFRPLALSRSQTVTTDVRPGVTVTADPDAMHTLLSVLMDNAVKYTPPGGSILLTVTKDKRPVLRLANTYENAGSLDTEHLFERFYRDPEHRGDANGHGLGLSIAYDIVELYGGSIRAEAQNGDTVIFTVEFS